LFARVDQIISLENRPPSELAETSLVVVAIVGRVLDDVECDVAEISFIRDAVPATKCGLAIAEDIAIQKFMHFGQGISCRLSLEGSGISKFVMFPGL
jgi:hypothetical protein